MLTDGSVDIIQPDLSHAGGISECKKIAAMAETFDVAVAPHCPLGPVAPAACVQLDMCTPNVFIQEQSLGIHYNQGGDLLDSLKDASPFLYQNGYIDPPKAPGLGIEVDEEKNPPHGRGGPQLEKPRVASSPSRFVKCGYRATPCAQKCPLRFSAAGIFAHPAINRFSQSAPPMFCSPVWTGKIHSALTLARPQRPGKFF